MGRHSAEPPPDADGFERRAAASSPGPIPPVPARRADDPPPPFTDVPVTRSRPVGASLAVCLLTIAVGVVAATILSLAAMLR